MEPYFIPHQRMLYTICIVSELRRVGPTFNSGALPRAQETEADHLAVNHKDHSPDPPLSASHLFNVRLLKKLLVISHRKDFSKVHCFFLPFNGSVVYNGRIGCVKSKQHGFSKLCGLITLGCFQDTRGLEPCALHNLNGRCLCMYTMYTA